MSDQAATKHWDKAYLEGKDFSLISGSSISKILTHLPEGSEKTLLDIGCGTGQLSRELHHRGFQVLGVDVSNEAIRLARARSVATPPRLQYRQMNIETESLEDTFSFITCKLVYAFIENKDVFLEKITHNLNPGGVFAVITPLKEDATPEKQIIAVHHEDTLAELTAQFTVAHYRDNGLSVYICTT